MRRHRFARFSVPFLLLAGGGLLVLAAPPVISDVIHLKSGGTLEGRVRRGEDGTGKEGTLTVRQGDGSVITLAADDVERVEKRRSPRKEFALRLEAAEKGEVEPLVDALVWAREKRLHKSVKEAARRILEVDPNHEMARSSLGFVVFENRWILKSELKERGGLVRFRGEWVSRDEKDARLREELRKELEIDLKMLTSDNPHIRRLSERKLRRVLAEDDPLVRDVLGEHLLHPHEEFRMLALAVLAQFPARDDESPERIARVAASLHELALREQRPAVRSLADAALAKFAPDVSFRLALNTARNVDARADTERVAEILYSTLRTQVVPALIAGLRGPDGRTHAAVLSVLRRVFHVDLGDDVAAWQRHWQKHRQRYRDGD